jgi:hypothetical protein
MNYSGAIIIQGQSNYVTELKVAWKDYHLIWSTWKGTESSYNADDVVIYNDMPHDTGTGNVALQQKTTLNGTLKAKELGFKRVLKWRNDMIPINAIEFINLFYKEGINMFYFYNGNGYKYFVDYFMEGTVEDIYNMWSFDNIHPPFAESALTDNIKIKNLKNINFVGKKITNNNDILWLKKNIKLSTYVNWGSFMEKIE